MNSRAASVVLLLCIMSGCGGSGSPSAPNPSATLSGYVRDGLDAPIPGATVQLAGRTATTDEMGRFSVAAVPPGTYTVYSACDGYYEVRVNFTMPSSSSTLDLKLKRYWDLNIAVKDATTYTYINLIAHTTSFADQNYGSSPLIEYGTSGTPGVTSGSKHGYVGFDLSLIPPDALIVSATFSIRKAMAAAVSVSFSQVLGPWDEYGITHNNRPSDQVNPTAIPTPTAFGAGEVTQAIDFTSYVRGIVTGQYLPYGLTFTDEQCVFHSRESQTAPGPTLNVQCIF